MAQPSARRALVVFCDTPYWTWLLKPGFRHVFCAIESEGYWIRVDAAEGQPLFQAVAKEGFDLAEFWRQDGHTIVETVQGPPVPRLFWPHNCVGMVKAALCIRSRAITPWQLYRYLVRRQA